MRILTQRLQQRAVYWPPSGRDGYGQPTYGTPVEIKVRWVDKTVEFLNPNGEREISNAVIDVDRRLEFRGLLWLGKLDDIPSQLPQENTNVVEVRNIMITPTMNARHEHIQVLV